MAICGNDQFVISAGKHTIFGRINKGISVVNRIGLVETDASDR